MFEDTKVTLSLKEFDYMRNKMEQKDELLKMLSDTITEFYYYNNLHTTTTTVVVDIEKLISIVLKCYPNIEQHGVRDNRKVEVDLNIANYGKISNITMDNGKVVNFSKGN